MKTKYIDLITQTYEFPQEEFQVEDNELIYNGVPIMDIIKQYGTPLKITFLPKISQNIQRARRWFNVAIAKADYQGDYHYSYCTKSSHFEFVMSEVLKNDVHIETSSAFDLNLIENLHEMGKFSKENYIICNGFKKQQYIDNISTLLHDGYTNLIPVLDSKAELDLLNKNINTKCKIGIRIAAEEEPRFEFYTSRLGIRYNDIIPFYEEKIKQNPKFELKMLHFFINTGIKDTAYYWNELSKCVNLYCDLKKRCPELDSLNIGGGFPIKNSLSFDYDYEYMAEEIVAQIKNICEREEVDDPDIFTEFGSYTVGEASAVLYSIVQQKRQNDRELWNMIDSSFMTTLPDTWAINQQFIILAVNNWDKEYERVFLGGLTCDSNDYYNSEAHLNAVFLPKITSSADTANNVNESDESPINSKEEEDIQYIGLFNTGAYQEALGGYGGIQHCLTPAPKHIIIYYDEDGEINTKLFAKEQSYKSMLKILGY
ncbi:MAG TPA: arginine decarboxylase [Bacteroidales bacterium]|nr:arginine decarboxylase [Bacteroidales bacterium]HOS57362.1 arginine decarboxylase [Bacteroidales bacterium]HRR04271.1 arginine decarboxylase [Bacteroidales bacterium]HRT13411.1 arginine decarboxylase [Bacteroidales bacterium]HXK73501.1 arginine decarboxylase [Bacteroidales bacterium]